MDYDLRNRHSRTVYGLALAGALLALGPADAWAQAANDVRCNKCVDTDDIDKKAVKKKNLAKDSVTSNRIVDGTIKTKDLTDGAVDGSKLEDGAVTGGKIANGAVSSSKLAPDAVFGRIIVVRADPVDTIGNCDALQDALAGITDNDADNRYLIHLEPGIYDCDATVPMKSYVDLQGSGRDMTLITGSVAGEGGLLSGASDAELRHLTVENLDVSGDLAAAITSAAKRFRISDVSALARNSSSVFGITLREGGTTVLTNVEAEATDPTVKSAQAILVIDASTEAVLVNVTARARNGGGAGTQATGLRLSSGVVAVARNSLFAGEDFAIRNTGTGNIVSSQVDGGTTGAGDFFCVGTYDGDFSNLGDDCAP